MKRSASLRRRTRSASPRASRARPKRSSSARPAAFSMVFGDPRRARPRGLQGCRDRHARHRDDARRGSRARRGRDRHRRRLGRRGRRAPRRLPGAGRGSLVGTLPLVRIAVEEVRAPVDRRGRHRRRERDRRGARAGRRGRADRHGVPRHRGVGSRAMSTRPHCSGGARHTTLTRAFSGRLARGLPNRLAELAPRLSSRTHTRATCSRPILQAARAQGARRGRDVVRPGRARCSPPQRAPICSPPWPTAPTNS